MLRVVIMQSWCDSSTDAKEGWLTKLDLRHLRPLIKYQGTIDECSIRVCPCYYPTGQDAQSPLVDVHDGVVLSLVPIHFLSRIKSSMNGIKVLSQNIPRMFFTVMW